MNWDRKPHNIPTTEKLKRLAVGLLSGILLYVQNIDPVISQQPKQPTQTLPTTEQIQSEPLLTAAPRGSTYPQKYLHIMRQLKVLAQNKNNTYLSSFIDQKINEFSTQPEKITKLQFWESQRIYLMLANQSNLSVVWGDSRTQYNNFLNEILLNFGISSTTSADFAKELEYLKPDNLKKIAVHNVFFGINDIKTKVDAKQIISNFETAIQKITAANPNAKIVIHAIIPPNYNVVPKTESQKALHQTMLKSNRNNIVQINNSLKALSLKYSKNATFSNKVEQAMTQAIQRNDPVSTDTLHFTELGNRIVFDSIQQH